MLSDLSNVTDYLLMTIELTYLDHAFIVTAGLTVIHHCGQSRLANPRLQLPVEVRNQLKINISSGCATRGYQSDSVAAAGRSVIVCSVSARRDRMGEREAGAERRDADVTSGRHRDAATG
jgi:hypothetical protein